MTLQSFRKSKNAKRLHTSSIHNTVAFLSKYFHFQSFNLEKKQLSIWKSLWNWFSSTPGREPKSWYESKFLCEKPKTACTRSHQCEKISVSKLSFNLHLVNGSQVKKFLEHKKNKFTICYFNRINKELEKIKFQPRKDQKNGTSKNDLKSPLGAFNKDLWAI